MGGAMRSIMVGEPWGEDDNRGEDLHFRSSVSRDGLGIDLNFNRGRERVTSLPMSFDEASLLFHELRAALSVAMGRHRMTHELAKETIASLLRTAIRPSRVSFEFDAKTGDTFVVYIFEEHAPFVVRMSQDQIQKAEKDLRQITRRHAN
jgi:hypothetical protein